MLLYNSFEDMLAKLSSENALYIDFLNKMSGVVEEVMFLSKNVWILIDFQLASLPFLLRVTY